MNDKKPFDGYTVIHFLVGYVARRQGASYPLIISTAILYEVMEDKIIETLSLKKIGWNKESKKNSLMDIGAALIGAEIANRTK